MVHATKFGQQAVAGYMRQPLTSQPIPSQIYMQRDASSFAVGAELWTNKRTNDEREVIALRRVGNR